MRLLDKSHFIVAATVLVSAASASQTGATDYFVDAVHGSATGNGTSTNPWLTVTQALNSGVLQAGSRVNILPGLYDTALGELFPMDLVPGVHYKGPGVNLATIRSLGSSARIRTEATPTVIEGLRFENISFIVDIGELAPVSSVSFLDNAVVDGPFFGILLRSEASYCGEFEQVDSTVTIAGNLVEGSQGAGVEARVYNEGAENVILRMSLLLENNMITGNAGSGISGLAEIRYTCFSSHDGNEAHLAVTFTGNRLIGNVGSGASFRLNSDPLAFGGAVSLTLDAEHNEISTNGGSGLRVFSHITDDVRVDMTGTILGNRITNNAGSGLQFDHDDNKMASLYLDLQGPAGSGLNTLAGNGPAGELVLSRQGLPFPQVIVPAKGNWWDTSDLAEIEKRVFHFPDDNSLGLVDYSVPLEHPLSFVADPAAVQTTSGQPVTVTAGPATAFVPDIAGAEIAVTLGGVPVDQITVAPDHRSLTFRTPSGILAGLADLVITNPGGQVGRIKMEVGCTPAAYCTPKKNSCGTLPSILASGRPSAMANSGFIVSVDNTRAGESGLLMYTDDGPGSTPFHGGVLCLNELAIRRSTPITDTVGTPRQCNGVLSIDMNAFAAGALGGQPLRSLGVAGTRVNCQFWGRDTQSHGSLLSDALSYVICP